MRWIPKFLKLSSEEKELLAEAVFFLFFSKVLLFLPFRTCIKRLKPANSQNGKPEAIELRKIQTAVRRANKLACWKNICLVKSFAARFMLQRRNIGSVMYYGLQLKDGKKLIAHAWLVADNLYITPKGSVEYKEIFKV